MRQQASQRLSSPPDLALIWATKGSPEPLGSLSPISEEEAVYPRRRLLLALLELLVLVLVWVFEGSMVTVVVEAGRADNP